MSEQEAAASADGTKAILFDMAHDMMLEPRWRAVADHIAEWVAGVSDAR